MIIPEHNGVGGEYDLSTLWNVIAELGEQLNQNRSLAVSLYTQATGIKNQAVHSQSGFVLRRFNLDKTKEVYESELERMNAAMVAENQGLMHDNKQLNALIKDFETTLDSLMSTFRNRAQDVQERELSLIKEYETKLLGLEEENATAELANSTAISESLARLSHTLRQLLRLHTGEVSGDPDPELEGTSKEGEGPTYSEDTEAGRLRQGVPDEDREPWASTAAAAAEYALERDTELARLEKENEELRRMIGLLPAYAHGRGGTRASDVPRRGSGGFGRRSGGVGGEHAGGEANGIGLVGNGIGPSSDNTIVNGEGRSSPMFEGTSLGDRPPQRVLSPGASPLPSIQVPGGSEYQQIEPGTALTPSASRIGSGGPGMYKRMRGGSSG